MPPSNPTKTETIILASALDVLAREIHCEDGVATAAIAEAAQRLRELDAKTRAMDAMTQNWIEETRRASELQIALDDVRGVHHD